MSQNTSSAVMQQRAEPDDSLDDFPTPPWATRAMIAHVLLPNGVYPGNKTAREPACNRGYMARPLSEYFAHVRASDIFDYGYEHHIETTDYLFPGKMWPAEWTITNPPFRLAQQFIEKSFDTPGWQGTAVIVRSAFLEGGERYHSLFKEKPPSIVAQHAERVIMTKGIVRDPNKTYVGDLGLPRRPSTATSYCWLIWLRETRVDTRMMWIPPCRRLMEREGDYP